MGAPRSFLDNLANLRLVMSVALEHIQTNRDHFLKTGSNEELRQAQIVITKIQTLAEDLANEFKTLDALNAQRRRPM